MSVIPLSHIGRSNEAQLIEEIAQRPYREIRGPEGNVLCYPPDPRGGGGPLTIGGIHPDDWYAVDENGIATRNY